MEIILSSYPSWGGRGERWTAELLRHTTVPRQGAMVWLRTAAAQERRGVAQERRDEEHPRGAATQWWIR